MNLLYLYLEKYNGIQNQQYNFADKYLFNFDKNNKILHIQNNEKYIPDFFSMSGNNVLNIKAIVGENGVGKSTLLDYIIRLHNHGLVVDEDYQKYILIYTKNETIYILINKNMMNSLYVNNRKIDIGLNEIINIENFGLIKNIHLTTYSYLDKKSLIKKKNYYIVENSDLYHDTSLIYFSNQFNFSWMKQEAENMIDISLNNRMYYNEAFPNNFLTYEGHLQNPDQRFKMNLYQKFENKDIKNKIEFISNLENRDFLDEYLELPSHIYIGLDFMDSKLRTSIWGPEEKDLLRYERNVNTQFITENILYKRISENSTDIKTIIKQSILMRIIDGYFRDFEELLFFKKYIKLFKVFEEKYIESHMDEYINIGAMLSLFNNAFKEFVPEMKIDKFDTIKIATNIERLTYSYIDFISFILTDFFMYTDDFCEYLEVSTTSYNAVDNGITTSNTKAGILKLETTIEHTRFMQKFFENYEKIYTSNEFFTFKWNNLSQGEENLFSLLSELYTARGKLKCKDVILLIDEGDLTLHPEWQRKFIFLLLNFIQNQNCFNQNRFQIFLTTHSPLLISDLPKNNILFLYKNSNEIGIVNQDIDIDNTFAANIHNIYSQGQFLKSTTGEFATKKIELILDSINSTGDLEFLENLSEIHKKTELIGDELIQNQMFRLIGDRQRQLQYKNNSSSEATLEKLREIQKQIDIQIRIMEKNNDINKKG
ncbi:AAA family ATPase [Lysinibacillus sp. NPDC094177]|uniref:AAA family ATPase n=1 Tax=Lysinibacillus sp. NPDC094177 TaxID=3390580 RepID=UPI003D012D58